LSPMFKPILDGGGWARRAEDFCRSSNRGRRAVDDIAQCQRTLAMML
jgi:hypothetical protein